MSSWNDPELKKIFLEDTPLIDVRAPIEFKDGSVPNAINLPIMNDEERTRVGTCYKEHGQEAAIKLGHELVSGSVKEKRIASWRKYVQENPRTEVFCFRGGLRSQISCQWIDMGKKPITGGYKRLRRFFLSWLEEAPLPDLIRIGGPTGSGKSEFIKDFPHIDLEEIANHRGSAFGVRGLQPTQINFENGIALELLKLEGKTIVVEDESAVLGKVSIPKRFFHHLRHSPMVVLEIPIEERVQHIFKTYVEGRDADFFFQSLDKIQKSLGGVNFEKVKLEMTEGFSSGDHRIWITSLLRDYYDPHYRKDLDRQPGKILFRGSRDEVRSFLKSRKV